MTSQILVIEHNWEIHDPTWTDVQDALMDSKKDAFDNAFPVELRQTDGLSILMHPYFPFVAYCRATDYNARNWDENIPWEDVFELFEQFFGKDFAALDDYPWSFQGA